MAKKRDENYLFQPLTGMILDDQARLSLEELCEICGISAETIVDMIDEGLLEPQGRVPGEWRFRCYEVRRVQVALRLQQDLRVNLPGAALILDLLEELEELRRRL
ncbi:MAG: chaperone modulator CbpM [Desulfobulbaceae bacterium]|nr:chaperone modulator CbpM [Desulfobulbaceae bacterium]